MATTASEFRCKRHTRHMGACPACQRVQLARWREQLVEADAARNRAGAIGGAQVRVTGGAPRAA